MTGKSQAEMEQNLRRLLAQVENGETTLEQGRGRPEEWIIQLGNRQALLDPNLQQWLWHDRLHDEWIFADCSIGEALLFPMNKSGVMKKLPYPDHVENWLVLLQDGNPLGPIRVEEARHKLRMGEIKGDDLAWSAKAVEWMRADDMP